MPCEWKMVHLAGLSGLFKQRQCREQNVALSRAICHLPQRPSKRVFNGRGTRDAHRPVEIRYGCEDNRRKAFLLNVAGSQSDRLAAEGSGGCEQGRIDLLAPHLVDHGRNGCLDEFRTLPLKTVK